MKKAVVENILNIAENNVELTAIKTVVDGVGVLALSIQIPTTGVECFFGDQIALKVRDFFNESYPPNNEIVS